MSAKKTSKLSKLLAFDADIIQNCAAGTRLIGVDEVGRGSCVGPVYAAAVCFPENLSDAFQESLKWLDDSKQLTPGIRAEICESLQKDALYAVGEATKDEVDGFNVYHASLLAASRAYEGVLQQLDKTQPTLLLLDGKALLPGLEADQQQAVIKGDTRSAVIAAASVIAKHLRDGLMIRLAEEYPGYSWETNMGYPTPPHKRAIMKLGPTPYHRRNYKAVREAQLSLL